MKHLMIDLETLGTTADAVILSVGAVKFDLESDAIDEEGFYGSISIESNMDLGRKIDEDTLLWWLKQPAAAQNVFHEDKLSLEQTLMDLSDWLGNAEWIVWAKGPGFDVAMLEHAYKRLGMSPPWAFWNVRCVRTYMALPGAKGLTAPHRRRSAQRTDRRLPAGQDYPGHPPQDLCRATALVDGQAG